MLNLEPDNIDELLPKVDSETNLPVQSRPKEKAGQSMLALLQWAARRRGGAFAVNGKQFAAMKRMKQAGISPQEIKNRWLEMETDSFYADKGFDFATVAGSFDRKRHE